MSTGRTTALILMLLIGGELLFAFLYATNQLEPGPMPGYRTMHLIQMVLVIFLAIQVSRRAGERWLLGSRLLIAGLALSLVGDIINSFLIDFSFILKNQVLLSILPFSLAHLLYINVFWRLSNHPQGPLKAAGSRRRVRRISLLLWPIFAVGLWTLITSDAGLLLRILGLPYAFLVIGMAITTFWVRAAWGRPANGLLVAGCCFVVSDCLLGLHLELGAARPFPISQAIWLSYLLAQCLIARTLLIPQRRSARWPSTR